MHSPPHPAKTFMEHWSSLHDCPLLEAMIFSWKKDMVLESRLHCCRKSAGGLPGYSLKKQLLSILYVLSLVSYSLLFAMHTKWAPHLREKIRGTIRVWELYEPDPLHLDNEGKKLKPHLSGPNVIWHLVLNVVKPNPNGTRANSKVLNKYKSKCILET